MRLRRNNDDPKVLDDLELLARDFGPADRAPQPLATEDRPVEAETDVAAARDPFADPFVHRFVQVSVHAKRYASFYAGAFAFFLAMVLIQPVGSGDDVSTDDLALGSTRTQTVTASNNQALRTTEPDQAAAPVFDALGGSSATSFGAAFNSAAETEFTSSPIEPDSDSGTSSGSVSFPPSFGSSSFEEEADEPEPLEIVATGYASATGGTALEQQPPAGGLPIAATGGNETKRSFVRLSGDETILRLQIDAASTILPPPEAPQPTVKACPILDANWKTGPNQPLSSAPRHSTDVCTTATPSATGIWTFDLTDFKPVEDHPGFALVMGPGTAQTFQIVFKPVAVPPED